MYNIVHQLLHNIVHQLLHFFKKKLQTLLAKIEEVKLIRELMVNIFVCFIPEQFMFVKTFKLFICVVPEIQYLFM